ncbi:MAG: adenylosuccinate synthase [Bdellovibrionales bacterium]|nr:adenylosuccinate synthase [Bdellovibrionales bacterium]
MPGIIVVGSQWGDEGKGKVVDVFSAQSDLVVRYQGGANAGHTLKVDGKETILHLVPSGVLHENTTCIIGAGVVLDVVTVAEEIRALKANGLLKNPNQLLISDSCTVIMDYHKHLDRSREVAMGNEKIGTTGKGIGPAYEDRASRKAVLFGDLFNKDKLITKVEASIKEKNFLLENMYGQEPLKIDQVIQSAISAAKELEVYRCNDTSLVIDKALREKKKVLFEGAQGTLLDLLHGTYPYVTSSSTIAGSACIGSGVGPGRMNKVVGITKAYTTRVGSGPFPTELNDEIGDTLQKKGHEFGATTGRRRRCGWLDLVALKYAIRINGITSIALMKIDVLSGLDEIQVCTAYELDGQVIYEFPVSPGDVERVKPIYQSFMGWQEDISAAKEYESLPENLRKYVRFISDSLKTPVDVVSVGPGRDQTLWLKPLFETYE